MTPLEYYREKCQSGVVVEDANQLRVIEDLQQVYHNLIIEHQKRAGLFSFIRKDQLIPGIYLWGGVGIGKTFLMDCFYHSLPFKQKLRMHFHAFMKRVHEKLKLYQGRKNPLDLIAAELAAEAMVICFDELFVSDITDAMVLGRLFNALFANGVTLVITSNTMPDDLYKRGLQRQQFLPAIALLKQYCKVIHLPTQVDYRLRLLETAGVYYTPDDANAERRMAQLFDDLSAGHEQSNEPLRIHERDITVRKKAGDIVWFDFNILCSPPRSQLDYLSIANSFHIVFLSHIPVIRADAHNTIALFIRLIDVLYDAKVRLVFSSQTAIDEIYKDGNMKAEFVRIKSRLKEMQSTQYGLLRDLRS